MPIRIHNYDIRHYLYLSSISYWKGNKNIQLNVVLKVDNMESSI